MSIVTVLVTAGIVAAVAMALAPDGEAEARPDQKSSSKQPALACRLGALTAEEREQQKETRARLERATTRIAEDGEGYTFHYAADLPAAAVIAWVELERKCCPFLRFTLDMPEEGGPSRLRVWGVEGVKAFLSAEMKLEKS